THDLSIGLLSSATADDLIIGGTTINADPALVVQLLTFYAAHEQARPELGTEASLQRVQAGRFDV
ncbi:hypothetical protein, partial [Aeromicrobium sp.]|uniref:hypothetical protein n=1 Tax=Aeromicrobium sp. TaxID=1871063 RepID=UPI0019A1BD33